MVKLKCIAVMETPLLILPIKYGYLQKKPPILLIL